MRRGKKESCAEVEEIGEKFADGDDGTESEEEDEELVDLPSELAAQLDSTAYASEEDLRSALDIAGIGDLPIILVNGKPRLVMPSDQHNAFTSDYVADLFGKT